MATDELFDEADRILIATVDTALEVGLGRTFDTPAGHTCRVVTIEAPWVEIEVMRHGTPTGERLALPMDIRRIATATALARRNLTDAATRRN